MKDSYVNKLVTKVFRIFNNKLLRFVMPNFFTDKEMLDLFGCDHQGLYEVRDTYVLPFLATPGPGGGRR